MLRLSFSCIVGKPHFLVNSQHFPILKLSPPHPPELRHFFFDSSCFLPFSGACWTHWPTFFSRLIFPSSTFGFFLLTLLFIPRFISVLASYGTCLNFLVILNLFTTSITSSTQSLVLHQLHLRHYITFTVFHLGPPGLHLSGDKPSLPGTQGGSDWDSPA